MRWTTAAAGLMMLWILLPIGQIAEAAEAPDFLKPYPNSTLEFSESLQVPEYRLVLGKLRIISNQIRSKERWVRGSLTRLTYRIPNGHSSQSAFEYYEAQLQDMGAEILFHCASRDCGRSNDWANDIFKIANLYGIDREQNYLVAQLVRNQQVYEVVLYTIMRGNQRVYAHLDILATDKPVAPETEHPHPVIALDGNEFSESLVESTRGFLDAARQQPEQQVWIVVHTLGDSMAEAKAQGDKVGEQIKLWLVKQGIVESRLHLLNVGPLAPAHDPQVPEERVELFLMQP